MKRICKSRRGAAMIMVLCIMVLLFTLGLSLLYGASQVAANANKRTEQVRAQEIARSFSKTLADTLIAEDGSMNTVMDTSHFCYIVQYFLSSSSYLPKHWYETSLSEGNLPQGCTGLTVSLKKSELEVPALFQTDAPSWIDPAGDTYYGYLDIQVTACTPNAISTITCHYECQPDFSKLSYYYVREGQMREAIHQDSQYLDKEENAVIIIGNDINGDPIYVTDDVVTQSTGHIYGSERYLYSGFTSTPIPYKLVWHGEV